MSVLAQFASRSLSLVLLLALLPAGAALGAEKTEPAPAEAVVNIALDGFVYESGQPIVGQLVVRNDGGDWLKLGDLADIASSLRLRLPSGEEVRAAKSDAFAAARTKEIGPGGFVGVKFDALRLFPQLARDGAYTLTFKREGMPSPSVPLTVIPAFDPSKTYRLIFATPDGELAIELAREMPRTARSLVMLARAGFFENAAISTLRPGYAFSIASTRPGGPVIEAVERTPGELLAGTVVLEPSPPGVEPPHDVPTLIVLLAPRPEWQGQVTAIGRVVESDATLARLVERPASGGSGSSPWKPMAPITLPSVRVVEQPSPPK